ncbi:unnamed protein product, partial [Didymodactylos carnosus]
MASSGKKLTDKELKDILQSDEFWEDLEEENETIKNDKEISNIGKNEAGVLSDKTEFADASDKKEEDNELFSEPDSTSEEENDGDVDVEEIERNTWYGRDKTKW